MDHMIQNIGQQPNSFLSHHRIMAASSYGMYFQWRLPFFRRFPLYSLERDKMRGEIVHNKIVRKTR